MSGGGCGGRLERCWGKYNSKTFFIFLKNYTLKKNRRKVFITYDIESIHFHSGWKVC